MVTQNEIDRQLKAISAKFAFWGGSEVRELEHIILPGETIRYAINGWYEQGFALLVITDHRVMLIDKKPLHLTVEDVRFDMISELDFNQGVFDARLEIFTVNKALKFNAFKVALLRQATAYLQGRVIELRMAPTPTNMSLQSMLGGQQVGEIEHRITNPYTKVPLMMRRRITKQL